MQQPTCSCLYTCVYAGIILPRLITATAIQSTMQDVITSHKVTISYISVFHHFPMNVHHTLQPDATYCHQCETLMKRTQKSKDITEVELQAFL